MILVRLDGVDTDGVSVELLQDRNVTSASGGISERIGVVVRSVRAVGRDRSLVGDTTDEELSAIVLIEEVLALLRGIVSVEFAARQSSPAESVETHLASDRGKVGSNGRDQETGSSDSCREETVTQHFG